MRVFNLRVNEPDFWPVPGISQKCGSNIPERVADLHDVLIRSTGGQRHGFADQHHDWLMLRGLSAGTIILIRIISTRLAGRCHRRRRIVVVRAKRVQRAAAGQGGGECDDGQFETSIQAVLVRRHN